MDYEGFVEKFKPKKTTDDCYTPPEVMEVVNAYVERRWGIDRSRFVRPFYPGGDYEHFDYSADAVVVDNPPFSILGKIKRFYLAHDIPFFLFCPSLTAFCWMGRTAGHHRVRRERHVRERSGSAYRLRYVAPVRVCR